MTLSPTLTETILYFCARVHLYLDRSAASKSNVSVNNSVDAKPAPRGFAPNTNIWSVIAHDKSIPLSTPIVVYPS